MPLDKRDARSYITCMVQEYDPRELYGALSELARRYQFRNRDEVCCYGLTVSQCYALEALADKGTMSSSEMASWLGLDLSSTTRVVDQLVRKKLATRRRAEQDGRIKQLDITDAGRRLVTRLEEDFTRLLSTALSGVPVPVLRALPGVVRRLAAVLGCREGMPCGCTTGDAEEPGVSTR